MPVGHRYYSSSIVYRYLLCSTMVAVHLGGFDNNYGPQVHYWDNYQVSIRECAGIVMTIFGT